MSSSTKWKLEIYKKSYECEDHWQLRRNFMLEHKNTIPEDELVCLAQVFINVEILGCRYSDELMQRIADLSKNVTVDRRHCIRSREPARKRNNVRASDAASSNVKKEPAATSEAVNFPHNRENKLLLNEDQLKLLLVDLVYFDGDSVKNNFVRTCAELKKGNLGELRDEYIEEENRLKIYYRDYLIFSYTDRTVNKKQAKRNGFIKLEELFRSYCYSIKIKKHPGSAKGIELLPNSVQNLSANKTVKLNETKNFEDNKLQDNNIGFKMLKSMGWNGGALGNNGLVEPIGLKIKVDRKGLGENQQTTSISKNGKIEMNHLKKMITDFKTNESAHELIFKADLKKEDRATLHNFALKSKLESKSYGQGADRQLVIRKTTVAKTLIERIRQGDPTLRELYHITPPTIGV